MEPQKGHQEYIEESRKFMEARKQRQKNKQKEQEEIFRKEANFCQYVNGPNKDLVMNKELHELKKHSHKGFDAQRRKWHSPDAGSPPKTEQEYENPVF